MKKLIIKPKHLDKAIEEFVPTEYGGNYSTTCLVTQAAKELFEDDAGAVWSAGGEIKYYGDKSRQYWVSLEDGLLANLMNRYDHAVFMQNQEELNAIRSLLPLEIEIEEIIK